jgi:translation elongation factor EF-1alpha
MDSKRIAVIGHIDAGKSTLFGHLLYLLKQVDNHAFEQIKHKAHEEKE